MRDLDLREKGRARLEINDELKKIQIGATPEKFIFIEQELPKVMKSNS